MQSIAPSNSNGVTVAERVRYLRRTDARTLIKELRDVIGPWLTDKRISESSAPLILRLMKIRLRAGNLSHLLCLRTHPQIYAHKNVLSILEEFDLDYLEMEETILEEIAATHSREAFET